MLPPRTLALVCPHVPSIATGGWLSEDGRGGLRHGAFAAAGPIPPAGRPLRTGHSSGDPGCPRARPVTTQPAGSTRFHPCLRVPNLSTWAHGGLTCPPSLMAPGKRGRLRAARGRLGTGRSLPFASQTSPEVWVRSAGPARLSGSSTQKVVTGGQASVPMPPCRLWPPGI